MKLRRNIERLYNAATVSHLYRSFEAPFSVANGKAHIAKVVGPDVNFAAIVEQEPQRAA